MMGTKHHGHTVQTGFPKWLPICIMLSSKVPWENPARFGSFKSRGFLLCYAWILRPNFMTKKAEGPPCFPLFVKQSLRGTAFKQWQKPHKIKPTGNAYTLVVNFWPRHPTLWRMVMLFCFWRAAASSHAARKLQVEQKNTSSFIFEMILFERMDCSSTFAINIFLLHHKVFNTALRVSEICWFDDSGISWKWGTKKKSFSIFTFRKIRED